MKTFKAIYDNTRTITTETGEKINRNYYKIIGMTPQEHAVYRADKGDYYAESKDGIPCYHIDNVLVDEIPVKRASNPNKTTGKFSWYHGRAYMQILENLVEQFPSIAKFDMEDLKAKAKKSYLAQYNAVAVGVDATSAVDGF
jgi:hypothetical protein